MSYYHSKYSNRNAGKRSKFRKIILRLLALLILIALGAGYLLYTIIFKPNIWTPNKTDIAIYIPTGANFDSVKNILYTKGLVVHRNNFEWLADKKAYPSNVKPGRYIVKNGMSNNALIDLLRSGAQSPVKVTFNNIRDIQQLAGIVSKQIEADSASIVALLQDSIYVQQLGFDLKNLPSLFIPNTYEFYWTTDANGFISRMLQEYHKFWNESRKNKAIEIGLSPQEVSTLASIVERETNKNDEKARIAGVYLNRLKSGWRLQADPTLVFAAGDFNIRRVLDVHKLIDSPYNTYKYSGLPPGPITIPSISSIDAVLNPEKHRYYFFCARDDLSGYHAFAETVLQHERNAWKYRQALDKLNIKK